MVKSINKKIACNMSIDAKYIQVDKKIENNTFYEFGKNFYIAEKEEVILSITCDSEYCVYINNQFVHCGQFPDYNHYKVINNINVTNFLCQGENYLSVILWYWGEESSVYSIKDCALKYSLVGQNTNIFSDKMTLSRRSKSFMGGEIITEQLGRGYNYDATKYDGFIKSIKSDFVESREITPNFIETDRKINLLDTSRLSSGVLKNKGFFKKNGEGSCLGEAIYNSYFSSVNSGDADGEYYIFDMQKEVVGHIFLDLISKCDCRIDISYGEHLQDLRVMSYNAGRSFSFTYNAVAGDNIFTFFHRRYGLRYLQLFVYGIDKVEFRDVGVQESIYSLSQKEVYIEDNLERKIYDVAVDTLRLCIHDHYEDCPWREQALYGVDSRIQMLCGYYAFGETAMAKESLGLFIKGQREDGLYPLVAPSDFYLNIPSFSLGVIEAIIEYYQFSKDLDFLIYAIDSIKIVTQEFNKRIKNGLLLNFTEKEYWNFYEWNNGLDGEVIKREKEIDKRYELPLNAYYYKVLNDIVGICKVLEEKCDIAKKKELCEYRSELKKILQGIKKAYDDMFYDKEKGLYCAFNQNGKKLLYAELPMVMSLYSGIVDKEKANYIVEWLTSNHGEQRCTLSMNLYKYMAILDNDISKLDYVRGDIISKWGKMLYNGATSFYETEKGNADFDNAGSLCHGWSGIPAYIYCKYGICKKRRNKNEKSSR